MNAVLKKIGEIGIVPVVKIENTADAVPLCRALFEGGLPLAEIKGHMDKLPTGHISAKDWHVLSKEWRAMVDERITGLQQLRDQLESCIGCGCLSLKACPLRNPEDILSREGPGAHLLSQKKTNR